MTMAAPKYRRLDETRSGRLKTDRSVFLYRSYARKFAVAFITVFLLLGLCLALLEYFFAGVVPSWLADLSTDAGTGCMNPTNQKSMAPVVNTTCGLVMGVNSNGTFIFKGIPYSLPPIGQLRWQPPVARSRESKTCWNGTYAATMFATSCFQPVLGDYSKGSGSEDCLYLNVWTPNLNKTAKLPVMIWIHGGFLVFSSGNWPDYSPTENLTRDTNIVYASMNYRLNAFGFMALDALSESSTSKTSGNYGFRDQLLAIHWIRDNIEQFGGDPNKMTVFGQSSGGTSIFALLASPMARNLFQAAWLLSASPILNKTLEQASQDNLPFLRKTGCSDSECLRELSTQQVFQAIPWFEFPFWAMSDQGDLPVKNVFDGALAIVDGVVLPKSPFDAWRDGEAIDVPIIIGTTAQELDFLPTPPNLTSWTWADYENHVHKKLDTFGEAVSKKALMLYPPMTGPSPVYEFTTIGSDLRVTCPNNVMAEHAANGFTSPVYRYVITSWPSQPVHPLGVPFASKYAFHMWDLIAFLGVITDYIKMPSQNDKSFEMTIRDEVLNFVGTGTVKTQTWLPYPRSTALINVSTTVVQAYNPTACQYWEQLGFFSYAWIN